MSNLNWLAWVVASVLPMAIGMAWYSPMLFGKAWSKEMGWSDSTVKQKQKEASKGYMMMLVGNFVMAYVLGNLVNLTQSWSAITGLTLGFWCWLGFVATMGVGSVAFEGKSWKLFGINQGYNLVMLLVMGAIFGAWR